LTAVNDISSRDLTITASDVNSLFHGVRALSKLSRHSKSAWLASWRTVCSDRNKKGVAEMTQASVGTADPGSRTGVNRWLQLLKGMVCMPMIANLQYGWSRANVPAAFTNFVR
jgi:hypothetical protein